MRRIAKPALLVLTAVGAAAAVRAEPPVSAIPASYRGINPTERTRLTAVWGHAEQVGAATSISLSPDGKLAVSGKVATAMDAAKGILGGGLGQLTTPQPDNAFTLWDVATL